MTHAVNRGGTSPLLNAKINPKSFNVTGQVSATAAAAAGAPGLGPPPLLCPSICRGDEPCLLPARLLSPKPTPLSALLLLLSPWLPSSPMALPCPAFPGRGADRAGFVSDSREVRRDGIQQEELRIWPSQEKCSRPPGKPPALTPHILGSHRHHPSLAQPPELWSFAWDGI